jgi:hypothetical protein
MHTYTSSPEGMGTQKNQGVGSGVLYREKWVTLNIPEATAKGKNMSDNSKDRKSLINWKIFDSMGWKILGGLLAVAALFFSLDAFVDTRISYKLRDPEVVRQIAYLIRPSLIFDQNGNFEIDNGAGQSIKDISVEKNQKGEVQKVIVSPKESLNIQPLLTCLNGTIYFNATRQKTDWIFQVVGPDYVVFESYKKPEKYLFELQIIR